MILSKIKENIHNWTDLIDYWALDLNHQATEFNVSWVSYRTPRNREISFSTGPLPYKKVADSNIALQVVDIFGTKTEKKIDLFD